MSAEESATAEPGPDIAALARRVLRFDSVVYDRVATQRTELTFGVARLNPELSKVYSLNGIEVTRPAAVTEVLAASEAMMGLAGLRHRLVYTTVPEVAWTLTPALIDRGWSMSRTVYMVHDGMTRPALSPLGIGPVGLETWAAAAKAFTADNEWGRSAQVQADMAGRDRRFASEIDTTFVLSYDGSAGCHVYRGGGVAQIENVHVLSEARGQGLGAGLLAAAIHATTGMATVFLIADVDDWPREWYQRRGFIPVASGWEWLRLPVE